MSTAVIYSFKEYLEKYTLALGDFCKNIEFDEIDFIATEIDCYNVYLTSLSVYKRIRNRFPSDPFLDEDTIFLNTNCTSYDCIVEALKNKAIGEGLNRTDSIISSYKIHFNKIISFLETKRADIYKEQALLIQQTESNNMRDILFEINKKNYLALEKEYEFTESEGKFIYRNFWPIIVVNSFDAEWIKNQLDYSKTEFIKENKVFNLDIFKRNITDFLISEIKEYLDNIQKGKTKVWTERKGDYFHWFKLQFDTKSYTLLISDKNEIQLEIYFTTLLSEISKFIENEQALSIQQIETKPEIEQAGLFENNFDKVKPIEICNHFKVGLVDKGYLTEQELNEYLKAAFELQTIPETLFKIKDASTKQKITNVFYQYFRNIAGTPHGKQKQYAALLGDYFEGYVTKNVSTNFNK
jgi:hypothetical protein